MLFYRSSNPEGQVEAVYNGQTAFLYFPKTKEFNDLVEFQNNHYVDELWALGQKPCSNRAIRISAHEYSHKLVYALSRYGLILSGFNQTARFIFLRAKSKKLIEAYYSMRTIYFMESYAYQESFAHTIQSELSLKKQSPEEVFENAYQKTYKRIISECEKCIKSKWVVHDILPALVARPLLILLGYRAHRYFDNEFTYLDEQGNLKHELFTSRCTKLDNEEIRWQSLRGELNKWMDHVIDTIASIKSIFSSHRDYFDLNFEWYWIGQRCQFQTLQKLYGMERQQFLDDIFFPNAQFIMQWAGIPIQEQASLLEFSEDTLLMDKASFMNKWNSALSHWKNISEFNRYFAFFIKSGN